LGGKNSKETLMSPSPTRRLRRSRSCSAIS
jgi:hypothetical protein